ncbi:uridine kinase [Actinomadura sp. 9N407]|uniref:uridine kinase n=1 Tax=Actinomadura sp. 9N407 TaxID=3375154 RepID=UPI003799E2D8
MPFVPNQRMTYPALAARLLALPPSCGPVRVVAVDGPSGAGKSTFADRLSRSLGGTSLGATSLGGTSLGGVPLVRSDDFRVPWDADPLTWWRPLTEAVLAPIAAGHPGRLRRYDWHHDTYGPEKEIPPAPVLILEGVGSAWSGSPAAYRIWIDAPRDLRRARTLERDGPGVAAAWDTWSKRERHHFATDATRSRADLLLDGTDLEDSASFSPL